MSESRDKSAWPENYWLSISRDTAVRRLFPDLSKADVDFETVLPGRNWEAGTLPEFHTDFDRSVFDLIESSKYKKYFRKQVFGETGAVCPYYAWRIQAILASENAKLCSVSLSNKQKKQIDREIEFWTDRVRASKSLLNEKSLLSDETGSMYFAMEDFDGGESERFFAQREIALLSIRNQISIDENVIKGLQNHLAVISRITMSPLNRAPADLWQMPFFNQMAGLLNHQIGGMLDTTSPLLHSILTKATYCLSGEQYEVINWGVFKTSNKKMELLEDDEGINIGRQGFYSVEEEEAFAARGQEMARLVSICRDENVSLSDRTVIESVLLMRDHASGGLAFLVRDVLLRNWIAEMGVTDDRTFIQLGWTLKPDLHLTNTAIHSCVSSANKGDMLAAAVVEALYTFDEYSNGFIRSIKHQGWSKHFAGFKKEDLITEYERLTVLYPTWPQQNGDCKAFTVAMHLLNNCYDTGT